MTEYEALMAAVCGNPDDDTPRLVLADWLQENGDESDRDRAELIRVQCRTAPLPWSSPERQKLDKRAEQLLRRHSRWWGAELPRAKGFNWGGAYQRGFIDSLNVSDEDVFLTHLDDCFQATPLACLGIHCPLEWLQLVEPGYLSRIIQLNLATTCLELNAHALCEIGPWPRLRTLLIADCYVNAGFVPVDRETIAALRKVFGEKLSFPNLGGQ